MENYLIRLNLKLKPIFFNSNQSIKSYLNDVKSDEKNNNNNKKKIIIRYIFDIDLADCNICKDHLDDSDNSNS